MTDGNPSGAARRRQLMAAMSVLGVSLGMTTIAAADTPTESASGQHTIKGDSSQLKTDANHIKGETNQIKGETHQIKGETHQLKLDSAAGGQSSIKLQNSYKEQGTVKVQNSYKEQGTIKLSGQNAIKGEAGQVKQTTGQPPQ